MAKIVYGIITIIHVAVGVMWLFHFVSLGVHLQSCKRSIFWTCNRRGSK